MKTYKIEFTEKEFQNILLLFNIAVKTSGLVGDVDVAARAIINKISQGEVKLEKSEE